MPTSSLYLTTVKGIPSSQTTILTATQTLLPPIITSVTKGDASAQVYFTVDANTTNIQYSLNGTNYTLMNTITSPYILSNLVNGNFYTVVLQAIGSIKYNM